MINVTIIKEKNYEISFMNETEIKYKQFCDKELIPTIYIHQSPSSFSKVIRDKGGKRPDFIHHTTMGTFYVDVKNNRMKSKNKYKIDLTDFNKLLISEEILDNPILLAYPIDPWNGEDWGFISLSKLKQLKKEQQDLIDIGYEFIAFPYQELKRFKELTQLFL